MSRYIDGDKLANTIKLKYGRYRRWKKIIYEGDFVHLYTQTNEKKLGGLAPTLNGGQNSSLKRTVFSGAGANRDLDEFAIVGKRTRRTGTACIHFFHLDVL